MPKGQLLYYQSRLDDVLQPLPICATETDGQMPLIMDVSPGTIGDLPGSIAACESMVGYAEEAGLAAVVCKPCGRGPGSMYQGPGEVDVFECLDFVCRTFPVDRERVSITGGSMGGAATWYIASHYPDQFAAAAPFCGYCDYRLWRKPGGFIMRTQDWEYYSWQSRDAAFRPGNLSNMALWIVHGEWDIGIGGGVPVEHSRQMVRLLGQLGIEHRYTEVPECGHGCMGEETLRPVIQWLCQQERKQVPEQVRLTAHDLRHNRSFWLDMAKFEKYGQVATAEAAFETPGSLHVAAENVKVLSLGPVPERSKVSVDIQDTRFEGVNLADGPVFFGKDGEKWTRLADGQAKGGTKSHSCGGPMGDIFFEPLYIVRGTHGSKQESFLQEWMAGAIPGYFKSTNGGVHRGIFNGTSSYDLRVVTDDECTEEQMQECNLVLCGTPKSNSVFARLADRLPVHLESKRVRLGNQQFQGADLGAIACFPSPLNPERYVVVAGGESPTSITNITHLNLQLLPDYLVWDGPEALAFGFFDEEWR